MTEARATHSVPRRDAPLTILFYSDAPYEGGAERYIEYLVDAYPSHWTIGVVLARDASLDELAIRLKGKGARVFRAVRTGAGALRAIFGAAREMTPDVVHINLPFSYAAQYTAGALVARLGGARCVVTTEHLPMFPPMRLRGRLRRWLTHGVDRVITLTRSNEDDLVGRHGLDRAKIRIVPNGVTEPGPLASESRTAARAALGAGPDDVLFLHIAALTERKGHRFLFDALASLPSNGWHVALVGDGEEAAELEARAETLGLRERITFAGWHRDAAPLIRAADVVLLPSRVEGMPLTLLEALACGCPAVATRVYGVPEIYGETSAALLVDYGDVPALATALDLLVRDAKRRQAMGRAARELYEQEFTASRMAARTIAVYHEALDARAS